MGGAPRLKKSFGTALKFFGEGWWPNLSTYAKLLVLTLAVVEDPGLVQNLHHEQVRRVVQQITHPLPIHWPAPPAANLRRLSPRSRRPRRSRRRSRRPGSATAVPAVKGTLPGGLDAGCRTSVIPHYPRPVDIRLWFATVGGAWAGRGATVARIFSAPR